MPDIHLICRFPHTGLKLVDAATNEWETGHWIVEHGKAEALQGGNLYIHDSQSTRSTHGGVVVAWRVHHAPGETANHGKVVFRYRFTKAHQGVAPPRSGWAQEKAYAGLAHDR